MNPPPDSERAVFSDFAEPEILNAKNVSDRACWQVIARHRKNLDWMLHVPEWEPFFEKGLGVLGLPQPRRGIRLRGVLDSLLLESKYQLILWSIEHYRNLFPSAVAYSLSEVFGMDMFQHKYLDKYLTETEWLKFQEYLHSSLALEHQRYKRAQLIVFRRYQSLVHMLTNCIVFDVSKRQDAFQEASLGLLHAIDKVNDTSNSFTSYAKTWVSRYIRNFLTGEHFPVQVPINLASKLLTSLKNADVAPIPSEGTSAPKDSLPIALYQGLLKPRVSIEAMSEHENGGQEIPDLQVVDPFDSVCQKNLFNEIRNLVDQLTDKQREVIALRYGLNDLCKPHTLSRIASKIGISHQQVSMREKRALAKLETLLKPLYEEVV